MTFENDQQAEKYLRDHGFEIIRGMIIAPNRYVEVDEHRAIGYLCVEWDFGYVRDQDIISQLRAGILGRKRDDIYFDDGKKVGPK